MPSVFDAASNLELSEVMQLLLSHQNLDQRWPDFTSCTSSFGYRLWVLSEMTSLEISLSITICGLCASTTHATIPLFFFCRWNHLKNWFAYAVCRPNENTLSLQYQSRAPLLFGVKFFLFFLFHSLHFIHVPPKDEYHSDCSKEGWEKLQGHEHGAHFPRHPWNCRLLAIPEQAFLKWDIFFQSNHVFPFMVFFFLLLLQ